MMAPVSSGRMQREDGDDGDERVLQRGRDALDRVTPFAMAVVT